MAKAITRTIRIDQETKRAMQKLAEEEGTSVNFLANKAITMFLDWHAVARKFGLCWVADSLMKKLIECHDERKCEELGSYAANETVRPLAEYFFGRLSIESATEVLGKFSAYGGRFEFAESEDKESYNLLLKHSSGRKWSRFYTSLMETIFKEMLGKKVKTNQAEELCIIRIEI